MRDYSDFTCLLKDIKGYLVHFSKYVSGSCNMDYDDAYQELTIKLWNHLNKNSFIKTEAKFKTYIYQVLYHFTRQLIYVDSVKRDNMYRDWVSLDLVDSHDDNSFINNSEVKILLDQIETKLSRKALRVFKLLRQGYNQSDIASMFKVSSEAVSKVWRNKIITVV